MFEEVKKNLEDQGFVVSVFDSGAEASDYLAGSIRGATIGFGGSVTLQDIGLYEKLAVNNEVYWHWVNGEGDREKGASAQIYITSANGLAVTGEIINIDGAGNRVASTLYGHEKVYFIIGKNKLAPTYEEALWRARNIAGPKNARRLGRKTPCAEKADRCYNCKSPERICQGLVVLWGSMMGMPAEVVLVKEDLGY